ncbi:MAG TPA: response regulator [Candidatus Saccharimonadales bacterium]|nr:response regulator [Candidatus Saccharimonadales bacterium]
MNIQVSTNPAPLLIVDDSDDDIFLLLWGLKKGGLIPRHQVAHHGLEAIEYFKAWLAREGPLQLPALVLIDLQMPMFNGFELLAWVRAQRLLQNLNVYVCSTSGLAEDEFMAMKAGATGYFVKPTLLPEYMALAEKIHDLLPDCTRARETFRAQNAPEAC